MQFSTSYRKTVLPNGITIITDYMPGVRSISLGLWIWSGTRFEPENQHGVAHFLEHMVFKGTTTRSPFEIAQGIESLGGYINAFTGRELNCYFARILDTHLPVAVDILGDILMNSLFRDEDIEKEKGVVVEEIRGLEDSPEELVNELFSSLVWTPHPLSRPILGTVPTVESITDRDLRNFLHRRYHNDRMFVIASGKVDHDELVGLITEQYDFPGEENVIATAPVPADNRKRSEILLTDHAQVHMNIGGIGIPYHDENKYAMYLLNNILGGGMTSRLFQRIREEEGLAYSIYSDVDFCLDSGLYCISVGSEPDDIPRILEMVLQEFDSLRETAVSDEELSNSKSQLTGGLYLSMESTSNVMNRLARLEMYNGEYVSVDETVNGIEAVTTTDISNLAESLLADDNRFLAAVGPVPDGVASI